MRAVQVGAPGAVALVDLPVPEPGGDEILVRVVAAAICATDRKLVARGADPPRVIGHEAAGLLEDGTPVGVHPDTGCGRCDACRAGFENRCPGRVPIGLLRDGGMAGTVTVPARHVVPLDGVGLGIAPLLEPLACCLQATRVLGAGPGDRALVVGAGPMGILAAWALGTTGAAVAIAQRSAPRRSLAAGLGATVLSPEDDPAVPLGGPPTVALVTAPGAAALGWALERLAPGGRAHAFAGSPGGALVDANLLHYRHLVLVGGTGSGVADYRRARDLVRAGTVPLDRLPRATVPLDQVPDVLAGRRDPGALKVMVQVDGGG